MYRMATSRASERGCVVKQCKECKDVKPLAEFPEHIPGHHRSYCKPCYNMIRKKARHKRKEYVEEFNKDIEIMFRRAGW